jgi:hypothetical protein
VSLFQSASGGCGREIDYGGVNMSGTDCVGENGYLDQEWPLEALKPLFRLQGQHLTE